MRTGAILLVGGRSSRMGRPKAGLDWHGEPLAARLARVLARAVGEGPVVAVRVPGQDLPALPEHVDVVADPVDGEGPLRAVATGLAALRGRAEVAFVSSVDAPFLHARFVAALLAAVGADDDAAVPVAQGRPHPLAAAYRVALLPVVDDLLANGERRAGALLDHVEARFLDETALLATGGLREADPALVALRNVNTPGEYDAAVAVVPPRVTIELLGALVRDPGDARLETHASRLEQAYAAAGLAIDGRVVAAVNGEQIAADPWYPLAPGDRISLQPGSRTSGRRERHRGAK
jgi:molybdopterin-guanine dinucleotide biosynthesis protein A